MSDADKTKREIEAVEAFASLAVAMPLLCEALRQHAPALADSFASSLHKVQAPVPGLGDPPGAKHLRKWIAILRGKTPGLIEH